VFNFYLIWVLVFFKSKLDLWWEKVSDLRTIISSEVCFFIKNKYLNKESQLSKPILAILRNFLLNLLWNATDALLENLSSWFSNFCLLLQLFSQNARSLCYTVSWNWRLAHFPQFNYLLFHLEIKAMSIL
jgi:hypothetical protein